MAKAGKSQTPQYSASGKIIGGLAPEISSAIQSQILDPNNAQNLAALNVKGAVSQARAGYAARGLASSGIAQRGETEAAQSALLNAQDVQSKNLVGLLGAGNGSPTFSQPPTPRGIFGLK
jgi:hypothetical protein